MTVEQAVLRVLIDHVSKGEKRVKNYLIESAHPQHYLSGRARLRGLRKRGLVSYKFCEEDNTYLIYSTLKELEDAWEILTGKMSSVIRTGLKPVAPAIQKTALAPIIKKKENLTVDDLNENERQEMLTEIRQFREQLNQRVACKI